MATWQSQEIQVICKAEIQTKESDKSFFTLRQKSDQIRNPSVQQVNAANICLCYQKCISMWLPQRIWDKKQQIIWEIARNFESEFSQFEAAFVEVQSIFLQFCRRFNLKNHDDARSVNLKASQCKWETFKRLTDATR